MQFVTTKPALKKILKGILSTEQKDRQNHENMGKNKLHQMTSQANED
jgi:hypothetical protein